MNCRYETDCQRKNLQRENEELAIKNNQLVVDFETKKRAYNSLQNEILQIDVERAKWENKEDWLKKEKDEALKTADNLKVKLVPN